MMSKVRGLGFQEYTLYFDDISKMPHSFSLAESFLPSSNSRKVDFQTRSH